MLTPWVLERRRPLAVYGPPGVRAMTDHLLAAYAEDIRVRNEGLEPDKTDGWQVQAHEIKPGVVYRDSNVTVTAFAVPHANWKFAFGYRFETRDKVIVISGDTRPERPRGDGVRQLRHPRPRGVFGGSFPHQTGRMAALPCGRPHLDDRAGRARDAGEAAAAGSLSPAILGHRRRRTGSRGPAWLRRRGGVGEGSGSVSLSDWLGSLSEGRTMRTVITLAGAACVAVLCNTGCFTSKPVGSTGFSHPQGLSDLNGTYRNLAEHDPKDPGNYYLSTIIWPDEKSPTTIETIEVTALSDTALRVRAHAYGALEEIRRDQTFRVGKDFEFSNGRLHLHPKWTNTSKEPEAGGLFFVRTATELGIDKKGEGKTVSHQDVVGAVYLVMPIALRINEELRFVRVDR
jgi:hypothetical protein